MFKDKRMNIIVNKIGLSEQDANWCVNIHKKYAVWIANQLKVNADLKVREGDFNMILDWKKEEQELNLNDYTFETALAAARIAHGILFKENNNSLNNKNIVLDLGEFKWVQLVTQQDCKEEGSAMGHCIGGNGHANSIANGKTVAFSLRDEFNRPHLTLEARKEGGVVFEFKGRNNGVPKPQYIECYIELSKKYAEVLGTVQDYTFISGLQKNIVLAKRLNSVNSRTIDQKMKLELGLDMFERGELFMQSVQVGNETNKFVLPEEIKIYGNLIIVIVGVIEIPKDVKIGGSVSVVGKSIKLGENIKVGGNLHIKGNLKSIPNNLMVCGDIILPKSLQKKETEIKEKIIFGGRLIFSDTYSNMAVNNTSQEYDEDYLDEYFEE